MELLVSSLAKPAVSQSWRKILLAFTVESSSGKLSRLCGPNSVRLSMFEKAGSVTMLLTCVALI